MIEIPITLILDILEDLKLHEKIIRMPLDTRSKLYDLIQEEIERRR